jgi:pimeloyl-ACP methyl ester carboxylesterase
VTASGVEWAVVTLSVKHVDADWRAVDWIAHTREHRVRGRKVRYVDIGTGPTVVLIHGQGGAWQWWLRVLPALAVRVRVVAIDLAGFGDSDPVASGRLFEEQVHTVIGLLDHLRLAKVVVVGHSMGGLVSLQVAHDHPDRVSGLMLIDSGSDSIGAQRLRAILAGFRIFDKIFNVPGIPRAVARQRLLRWAFFATATGNPACVSRSLAEELLPRMAAPGFIATMEAAGAAVGQVAPSAVQCPTLVVWGAKDLIVPLATGRRLADAIPDARLIVLDGVGHCAMVESPEVTAALIADFTDDPVRGRPAGEKRGASEDPGTPVLVGRDSAVN